MQRLSFYILISLALGFYSCDPCSNLDCLSSNYFGQFRIISKIDGKDLVFGSNPIYDQRKIKFYTLNGNDTTFFDFGLLNFPGSGYDSILYVHFYPEANRPIFMKLSETDTDTINITYNSFKTKCCGTITEIRNFRFNNSIDIIGNEGTQEIKK